MAEADADAPAPLTGGAIPRIRLEILGVSKRRRRKAKRIFNATDAGISSKEIILGERLSLRKRWMEVEFNVNVERRFVEYSKES
jgi:hypothetical protein